MASSIDSEIYVFPQFCNAIRSPPDLAAGDNFNFEIQIFAKHSYTCGDNIIEECNFVTRWGCKYKSLSWDAVDRDILVSDFPYPLEKVKWDGAEKFLKNRDDLIQQILEVARTMQNVTPPFQDDDIVYVSLTFVKKVFVSPQEFELTKAKILLNHYESVTKILWGKVWEKINRLGRGSSLYEEFQCLEGYVKKILRETGNWRTMYFDENYEGVLIESLTAAAKRKFRLLPVVRSRMQFLQRVYLPQNELPDDCSICMNRYLAGSEAYNLPCSHIFHYGCIETWLLKNPSCPICRLKLLPTV